MNAASQLELTEVQSDLRKMATRLARRCGLSSVDENDCYQILCKHWLRHEDRYPGRAWPFRIRWVKYAAVRELTTTVSLDTCCREHVERKLTYRSRAARASSYEMPVKMGGQRLVDVLDMLHFYADAHPTEAEFASRLFLGDAPMAAARAIDLDLRTASNRMRTAAADFRRAERVSVALSPIKFSVLRRAA